MSITAFVGFHYMNIKKFRKIGYLFQSHIIVIHLYFCPYPAPVLMDGPAAYDWWNLTRNN